MVEGQTAETTVRLKAPTTETAVKLARFKLESKGWTVGKCTAIWTKLQHHWVNPAY